MQRFSKVASLVIIALALLPVLHGRSAPAGVEELIYDDGTVESGIGANGLMSVIRVTPTTYPATFVTFRAFIPVFSTLPSPVGQQFKVFAFTGAPGATHPPSNPIPLLNQTFTIPNLPPGGGFVNFQIQNGPTFNNGDFFIGLQAPNPYGGVTSAVDTNGQPQYRSFVSIDNGQTFEELTLPGTQNHINFVMRAVVMNNAQAAPKISVPTRLPFGFVEVGITQNLTLTVRNTGDAPLNITGVISNNAQFSLAPLSLPLTIPPGGEGQIPLRFRPTTLGAQNGTLTITSNDPTRPSVSVTLSGVGGESLRSATVFTNSGVAQTGSILGPPDGAGVFSSVQYAVFVPTGATQLKVDLTGNQDLDLYMRLKQRILLSNGVLLADYRSENIGVGIPESITVNSSSNPPLQSGLYNIGIANFGPGAANCTLTATVTGGTAPGTVTFVSSASFAAGFLASDQLASGYGLNLATSTQAANSLPPPTSLAGTTVKVTDETGTVQLAPILYASPGQINCQFPHGMANGAAFLEITNVDGKVSTGVTQITSVAPSLFTANANGQGVAAAFVLRVKADGTQSTEPVFRLDLAQNQFVSIPIDLGPASNLASASDQVYLILFGTGFRNRSSLSATTATIGGAPAQVLFAGAAPGYAGLDQVNLGPLSHNLAGRGEVDLVFTADGKTANTVKVAFK